MFDARIRYFRQSTAIVLFRPLQPDYVSSYVYFILTSFILQPNILKRYNMHVQGTLVPRAPDTRRSSRV